MIPQITLIAVMSSDGFITRGEEPNPGSWASAEDTQHYRHTLTRYPLLIVGGTTYRYARSSFPSDVKKLVLTTKDTPSTPDTIYASGQPAEVIKRYASSYSKALLVGGGDTYRAFLEASLVHDMLLTVEPVILKRGIRLFIDWQKDTLAFGFRIVKKTPLNPSGTILYRLQKY
jgi:dihydrofolate reductase